MSVIIRMSKIPLTTSLNSSNFDVEKLMLSVPTINIANILTLISLRFEIQSCWRVLSELIFITSGIKLAKSVFFVVSFFSFSDCSVLFGCQSSQALFAQLTLKSIFWWEKTIQKSSKKFPDNRDVLSFMRWIPSLHKDFYQYFRCIWKQNRNPYINVKKNLPVL